MEFEKTITYAVKHKREDKRIKSQSGGIFTALADYILKHNGKIYGCILNDKFEAIHIGTNNVEDRNKMKGSKYVQSNIGNCFKEIKEDLENQIEVLFSGTPCQVDGLKSFLGKEYENLYCVDIICHGVPSPLVWQDYIKWQEDKNNGKCINVNFRNKEKFGWHSHVETLELKKENEVKTINSSIYANIFYSELIVRPSCYYCPYKTIKRSSDISIGDYWGIQKINKEFDDNKGISLVLINNERGKELFEKVKNNLIYFKTKIEDSLQQPLIEPFPKPRNRERFWEEYYNNSFEKIVNKYGKHGIKWKFANLAKRIIKKLRRK